MLHAATTKWTIVWTGTQRIKVDAYSSGERGGTLEGGWFEFDAPSYVFYCFDGEGWKGSIDATARMAQRFCLQNNACLFTVPLLVDISLH